jgi:2-hydroxy-6-oxonona-2,4-dienedioate hydrolase
MGQFRSFTMAARVAGYKPCMSDLPDIQLPPEALALLRTRQPF